MSFRHTATIVIQIPYLFLVLFLVEKLPGVPQLDTLWRLETGVLHRPRDAKRLFRKFAAAFL